MVQWELVITKAIFFLLFFKKSGKTIFITRTITKIP